MKLFKNPVVEWSLWLGIPAVLYFTGLHTEVIGGAQRLLLSTGLIQADTETKPEQDTDANYNVSLRTLDGKTLSLRTLKGKVIFMNIWATWCPPCVAEMPGIQKLYEKTQSENIAFVMISVDKDIDKVRRFVKRKGYTFPVYQLADGSIPALYASEAIPTTFVISANGKLAMRHEGMADYNSDNFRDFLEKLTKQ
ncbi:MAG: TlpA family protein disulfide reductase [Cytophagales bacterium]|nr:TlpA family protein disulfide reductase [Cytophagales bacterium]